MRPAFPASSFRRPFQVYRPGPGAYVKGVWTETPGEEITIMASVQPAALSDYGRTQAMTGGDRIGEMLRVYTDAELNLTDPRGQVFADALLYPPCAYGTPARYRFTARSRYSNGVIPHFRYLATLELEP